MLCLTDLSPSTLRLADRGVVQESWQEVLYQGSQVRPSPERFQPPSLINVFSAFKIQTHRMFCDTTFNSLNTVLATIYQNFLESAMKFYRYERCISAVSAPTAALLTRTY